MERFYIYKLTFESGATYIGQHLQRKANDKYITSSSYYTRHPEDKLLKREIILDDLSDREITNIMETVCICADKAENTKNVNYNLGGWLSMGFCGWNKGISATKKQKEKISKKLKGRTTWNKGKKLSEEHKKKISEGSKHHSSNKGKKLSEETKQKMSIAHKGKPHSKEWNEKVGKTQKGKPKSKEAIEKMRKTKLGKKLSEEHKKKIANSQIGSSYWNNGIICKRFKKGEEPTEEGWIHGRLDQPWNKGLKLK